MLLIEFEVIPLYIIVYCITNKEGLSNTDTGVFILKILSFDSTL